MTARADLKLTWPLLLLGVVAIIREELMDCPDPADDRRCEPQIVKLVLGLGYAYLEWEFDNEALDTLELQGPYIGAMFSF